MTSSPWIEAFFRCVASIRPTGGLSPGESLQAVSNSRVSLPRAGFPPQVVDSLCTLGPIMDAVLVPSAYHVPRAALPRNRGAAAGGPTGRKACTRRCAPRVL